MGLDGIIHNACQTIRRPQSFYEHLRDVETNPGDHLARVQVVAAAASESTDPSPESNVSHSRSHSAQQQQQQQPVGSAPEHEEEDPQPKTVDLRGHVLVFSAPTSQQLQVEDAAGPLETAEEGAPKPAARTTAGGGTATAISLPAPANPSFPQGHFDVHGQQLDLRRTNSWVCRVSVCSLSEALTYICGVRYILPAHSFFLKCSICLFGSRKVQKLGQVHIGEAAECMAINALAPFAINSEFVDLMASDATLLASSAPKQGNDTPPRAKFIVNVSAMEGKFYRHKTANHPHTNMAKAALNMMTRTCAADLAKRGVFMTSVDTGT